jgi:hypothetical protein
MQENGTSRNNTSDNYTLYMGDFPEPEYVNDARK